MRLLKKVAWLAGSAIGIVGLVIVCIIDDKEARARGRTREREG